VVLEVFVLSSLIVFIEEIITNLCPTTSLSNFTLLSTTVVVDANQRLLLCFCPGTREPRPTTNRSVSSVVPLATVCGAATSLNGTYIHVLDLALSPQSERLATSTYANIWC
jgi:hypothetical protein